MNKNLRILITGINGFIGSAIGAELIKNHQVIGVDLNDDKILNFHQYNNFRFIKADILSKDYVLKEYGKIDIIIHCAALVHNKSKDLSRENFFRNNVQGTKNIINTVDKKCLKQIIFLSTISVYGNVQKDIIPDEETKPKPADFYGESKIAAENVINEFCLKNSIKYTIFRLTPVYGKDFLLNINKRILLPGHVFFFKLGNGMQKISLCSVKNVVRAIKTSLSNKKYFNKVLILKDSVNYSINNIIKIFKNKAVLKNKFVMKIPVFIPKSLFYLVGLILPQKGSFLKLNLNKLLNDSIYSSKKILSLKLDLKWDLEKTLKGE